MYCKYCGKELSNDSNYCPNCGKKQKELLDNKSHITSFISTHKRLLWIYFVWVLVHIALCLSSSPTKKSYRSPFNGPTFNKPSFGNEASTYDISDGFYPFNKPIGDVLNGENYYLSIIDNVDVYDASELFFYTTLFPLIILGLAKCKPFILRFLNKIRNCYSHWEKNTQNLMPLTKRFVGSIIDKILLITILTVGSIALNPFGAPSKLGCYIGILKTSPNNYEYIDQALINSYGTYYEGVSKGYQDLERLANDPPHIGTVMELDISITFTFIFLNLIYYFLFESILSASLGKRMAGGILLDYADEKISITKAFVRSLYSGILMVGSVYVLHFLLGLSYYIVIALFFLLMDGPILFTKKSLLDLCTNTRYIKRKWN